MSYKGYDFLYVNGSSHTAGGGFETHSEDGWFAEQMYLYYKKYYNITWKSYKDVNYAKRLSELLDIGLVNEAAQGGGLDRVVRLTYDFIESNWKKRHKFFIILETPDSSRLDLYYKPQKKYFICNSNAGAVLNGTPHYFPQPKNIESFQPDFAFYHEKFYDHKEHHFSNERKLLGLYSFCKRENIAIKLMSGIRWMYKCYNQKDVISKLDTEDYDLIYWAMQNQKQIKHETNHEIIDGHPGYFAHIEYANIWKNWLEKNLEPAFIPNKYQSNI